MEPLSNPDRPPWPTDPAKRVAALKGQMDGALALAFTPDRCLLATGGRSGTGRLWDVAGSNPGERAMIGRYSDRFHALAFSPDGRTLAAGSGALDGLIWLFDTAEKPPVETAVLRGARGSIEAVGFSPDGKLVAGGGEDRTLRVWEPGPSFRGQPLAQLAGHTRAIAALAFAPEGHGVATAGRDSTVRLWTVSRIRSSEWAALAHPGEVTALAYSPDGKTLATACQDQVIRLWDPVSIKPTVRAELRGHPGAIRLLLIAPKTQMLVSVGDGPKVINWDLQTNQPVREWELPAVSISGVALTTDGRYLAAGSADGRVDVYRVADKRS
jgi:WD40 repeat protein